MDSEDCLELAETAQLRNLGLSDAQIAEAKQLKRDRETMSMLRFMVQSKVWLTDPTVNYADIHLKLSVALDKLSQRQAAIRTLQEGVEMLKTMDSCALRHSFVPAARASLRLALAKLLFRDDRKEEAFEICVDLMTVYKRQKSTSSEVDDEPADMVVTDAQAEDAWYLAGWVRIHSDNHTAAYALWSEGHEVCQVYTLGAVMTGNTNIQYATLCPGSPEQRRFSASVSEEGMLGQTVDSRHVETRVR